jgi:hypothetical protein
MAEMSVSACEEMLTSAPSSSSACNSIPAQEGVALGETAPGSSVCDGKFRPESDPLREESLFMSPDDVLRQPEVDGVGEYYALSI